MQDDGGRRREGASLVEAIDGAGVRDRSTTDLMAYRREHYGEPFAR